jgi:hypothetical protein
MNSAGSANTASGSAALLSTTTGSYNTASGYRALYSNTTGNYNTAVGYGADVYTGSLTNATAIGANAVVDASNTVRIGDTNVQSIRAHVSGITADSDLREKKDIQDIGYGLSFIKTLRPVQYRLKEGNNRIDFGFIAQDIETLLGIDYNILGIGGTEERMLSLRYTDFIAPMVKAMQEQQVIIDDLKARIEKLEALLAAQP